MRENAFYISLICIERGRERKRGHCVCNIIWLMNDVCKSLGDYIYYFIRHRDMYGSVNGLNAWWSAARKYVLQGLTMEIDAFVHVAGCCLALHGNAMCRVDMTDWSAAEPHARPRQMSTRVGDGNLLAWLACAAAGKTEIYFSILSTCFLFSWTLLFLWLTMLPVCVSIYIRVYGRMRKSHEQIINLFCFHGWVLVILEFS